MGQKKTSVIFTSRYKTSPRGVISLCETHEYKLSITRYRLNMTKGGGEGVGWREGY